MARLPLLTAPGLPHHLIQRGNNRQAIFVDDADRLRFLRDLGELAAAFRLATHAYVLMPNHVHILATPTERGTLARMMQSLGRRYVRYFNDRHRRSGTLWEVRYRSTVVETDRYLLACMRYIELNPVRAGLVEYPERYVWSSHRANAFGGSDPLISAHSLYRMLGTTPTNRRAAYLALFGQAVSEDETHAMCRSTGNRRCPQGWLAVWLR